MARSKKPKEAANFVLHVMPVGDTTPHKASLACPCMPTRPKDTIAHHAAHDGRTMRQASGRLATDWEIVSSRALTL